MPFARCDGIETRYAVEGSGPPLLLFSPGGFNGRLENWREFGIYQRLHLLEALSREFTCITFDKRESGESGGRLEPLAWDDFARQGVALLDELGVERAHLLGGCIGCTIALHVPPERARSVVLYSPAGGAAYLATQRSRFADHLAFVGDTGLDGVVALVRSSDRNFAQDPRVGPWVSVIRRDDAFARAFAAQDVERYRALVRETCDALFDRETVPGAPEELLASFDVPALVVPGDDPSHATSAAQYLAAQLPHAEYWDAAPAEQTEVTAPARLRQFLSSDSPRSSA